MINNNLEIKIQAPEGMEIDKEHSTFECIKFKPKKLTYDYISIIMSPKTYPVYTIRRHFQKCDTFKKLLEVAEYLNGDWKPNWDNQSQIKYIIKYDHIKEQFKFDFYSFTSVNSVVFSSRENALRAIEIIGEGELKQLFS